MERRSHDHVAMPDRLLRDVGAGEIERAAISGPAAFGGTVLGVDRAYARRNPGKPNIEERFPLWTLAALRVASSKPGPEPFSVAEVLAAMPETVE